MTSTVAPSPSRWTLVFMLLVAATTTCWLIDHYVSLTSQAMIYVLAVVIASCKLARLESAACAVGAVVALNFFFVPPRWTLAVENREHLIALAVMLAIAIMTSRLATGLRRETQAAIVNEQRARQLQALATSLSTSNSTPEVRTLGQAALATAFPAPVAVAVLDAGGKLQDMADLEPEVQVGLQQCLREATVCGPDTASGSGRNDWYMALGERGRVFGAAWIRPADPADQGGREHAAALTALLAQALWRLDLNASMQAAQGEAQRQEMLNTFLAAISHDLRTPLATILGASSSLQTQRDRLSAEQQSQMLASIATEARYLTTLTDNTLQLARLANPVQDLHRDWESVEEIVGAALARVRPHDPRRRIRSAVPSSLPLLRVDPVLLGQLLINLLDNALKYSEGAVELDAAVQENLMEISVSDRGPGIAEPVREAMFRPYSRGDRSGQRGSGLGLAVCRAIAQAHGGSLSVENRDGGGSRFCLSLPIEEQP